MSLLTDHTVFAEMDRYSDGAKQSELSNESQHDRIVRGVKRKVPNAVFAFRFATAHTGRDPDREQLMEAHRKIKNYNRRDTHPVTCLILLRWDRWFRNAMAAVEWVNRFKEIGVEVNTVERWIEFDKMTDLMIFFLEQAASQKVSDDISDHTIRNQEACLKSGYYPYRTSTRYQKKVKDELGRRVEWLPASENLRRAGVAITQGSGITEAWLANGGREVLGAKQTFRDALANKRYQSIGPNGEQLNFAPLWDSWVWEALQKRLRSMKVLTKNQQSLSKNYLRGIVYGAPCYKVSTSSSVRNGSGKRSNYLICNCKGITHYRFRRDEVDQDFRAMLGEITATSITQLRLSKKAEKRSKQNTAILRADLKREKAKLAEAKDLAKKSVKFLLLGQITPKEKQEIANDVVSADAKVAHIEMLLNRQGEILSNVLQGIAGLGAVLAGVESNLQLRDFARMAFPKGLQYIPEKRIFRTTTMNAALSTIAMQSNSYKKLKIGAAALATTPSDPTVSKPNVGQIAPAPVMGGKPDDSRTLKAHMTAFHAYCAKYNIA